MPSCSGGLTAGELADKARSWVRSRSRLGFLQPWTPFRGALASSEGQTRPPALLVLGFVSPGGMKEEANETMADTDPVAVCPALAKAARAQTDCLW